MATITGEANNNFLTEMMSPEQTAVACWGERLVKETISTVRRSSKPEDRSYLDCAYSRVLRSDHGLRRPYSR